MDPSKDDDPEEDEPVENPVKGEVEFGSKEE